MKSHALLLLAGSLLAVLLLLAGCGGGSNGQVPTTGGSGGVTATAAIAGRAACAVCHADINTQYSNSKHGNDVLNAKYNDPGHASCTTCHASGFGEGGFVTLASTPQFGGINCEECHGPGSAHDASPNSNALATVPQSETTCWDCHSGVYKILRSNPGPAYEADLVATIANKVSGISHSQALYLYGAQAVDQPVTHSPHQSISNNCVACHLNPNQGDGAVAGADPVHGQNALAVDFPTCAPCHGSAASAENLFEEFAAKVNADLIAIGGATAAGAPDKNCAGGMFKAFVTRHALNVATNTPEQQADPYIQAYKIARWNFRYVINDKSAGAHNPPLTEAIIAQCKSLLSQ